MKVNLECSQGLEVPDGLLGKGPDRESARERPALGGDASAESSSKLLEVSIQPSRSSRSGGSSAFRGALASLPSPPPSSHFFLAEHC